MPRKHVVGNTSTVKMPLEMKESIIEWLHTDQAKALGFDSISDVVTAGVRFLLEKYKYYEKKKF